MEARTKIIEEIATPKPDKILGTKYDLFNDDTIHMIDLPGHGAGQMGVLLETAKKQYFLAADSVWLKKSYEEMILPNSIVRLFFHSWSDYKQSLKKVHDYHIAFPETVIVPTHCSASTDPLVTRKITMDEL